MAGSETATTLVSSMISEQTLEQVSKVHILLPELRVPDALSMPVRLISLLLMVMSRCRGSCYRS